MLALAAVNPGSVLADSVQANGSVKTEGAAVVDKDFEAAKQSLLPVSPGQAREFKGKFKDLLGAVQGDPVDMVRVNQTVVLEPGAEIPVLTTSHGYGTVIRFTDSLGNPWPIVLSSPGNPNWFRVVRPDNLSGNNVLSVSTLAAKAHSNVSVMLQGVNDPISISMRTIDLTNRSEFDGIVTYQVPGLSPLSPPPLYEEVPNVVSKTVLQFLNNIPPEGSIEKQADDPSVKAWEYKGQMYIRTTGELRWPGYSDIASSGNVTVYEMSPAPVLKMGNAVHGYKMVEIK
jgi:hypothetical protein